MITEKVCILKFLKGLIPPIIWNLCRYLASGNSGFYGDYDDWQKAKIDSTGYESDVILAKVKASLLKVKNGDAVYERDGVVFDELQYAWPLLASLMFATSKSGGRLNVLDFGGSLGSTYYQNKKFLDRLENVSWNIVEQQNFVSAGKEGFENSRLKFFNDFGKCIEEKKPNVLLLSGVIQYIEHPYALLDELLQHDFEFVIFDRTTFVNQETTRLAVQKVPEEITGASYPVWLFNEEEFLKKISQRNYCLIEQFFEFKELGKNVYSKGFLYEKKV